MPPPKPIDNDNPFEELTIDELQAQLDSLQAERRQRAIATAKKTRKKNADRESGMDRFAKIAEMIKKLPKAQQAAAVKKLKAAMLGEIEEEGEKK